ncbi:hypothetical protein G3I59_14250 [Amycolatopsis rubida]|uniref:Uncharacterized protein n=1 Tax=Amycolatopsis rubida TaxID=112413 RepID=A0ABX0BV45_9PSEU|nr:MULTISPECIES: hypothetical protein [Amycolatopsis]MYW91727.1 hypothetical protein [Amycolatopsis rubida]NEC56711.1 hypothetical protein [Amycolatopsis rubida]OAP20391.1 hypothetical protein A4R44_08815 [Amycolatopsis sp. M39]
MTYDDLVGSTGMQLIADIVDAADTGNLLPAAETADLMLAAGRVPPGFTRGTLIASFWYKALRARKPDDDEDLTKYADLGLRLRREGYCTDHDLRAGICSALFALGCESGELEAPLHDIMTSLLPETDHARTPASAITRTSTGQRDGTGTPATPADDEPAMMTTSGSASLNRTRCAPTPTAPVQPGHEESARTPGGPE